MMRTQFQEIDREARAARGTNVLPVALEQPADLLTPVSAYLRLASQRVPAFLLESVEGGERLARYSFVGVEPVETLTIRGESLERETSAGKREIVAGNPLRKLGARLSELRSSRSARPGLPPFCGGAVGYLGYDCVRFLEDIPLPPPAFDAPDACMMLFKKLVAFDHVRQRVILISNVFRDEGSLRSGFRQALAELEDLAARLGTASRSERLLNLEDNGAELDPRKLKASLSRAKFISAVEKMKAHIRAGDIFQGVPSIQFETQLGASPFTIYRALRTISPAPYLYFLQMKEDTLLGASPEMLVRVGSGTVETRPIAGTRPRCIRELEDRKLEKNLLASVKERAEHLMLVDLGRNDLGRVSQPGSVRVEEFMHVERYSHVMHLVSNVLGKLRSNQSPWDALTSCFPAGTLSGAPKIRAMQIISSLEPVRRGPYGGAVVYHDFSGRLDSCIVIRSLLARKNGTGIFQAGAGIVADSRPAHEYQEVLDKTRALRRAIALAQAGGERR